MVLSQDVTFDVGELRSLNALFKKQCFLAAAKMRANSGGDGGDSDLELDEFRLAKLEFCDVVCEEYPSLSRQLAMQLFDSFDEDNSGEVDLKEFTIGLLKVAVGTTPEKLELVFQVLDANADGSIGISELLSMIKKGNDECMAITHFTSEIVHTLDKDGDGTISRDEFTNAVAGQPVLYDVLMGRTAPALDKLKESFADMLADREMGMDHLVEVWERTSSGKGGGSRNREMNLVSFRKFMQENFECATDDMTLVNNLFLAMDGDGSGSLDYQELFYGLSCVTPASKSEKAAFYFALYDMDGSGEIDKDEVPATHACVCVDVDT